MQQNSELAFEAAEFWARVLPQKSNKLGFLYQKEPLAPLIIRTIDVTIVIDN